MQVSYSLAGASFHHFSVSFWWLACMSACVCLLSNWIVFANVDHIKFVLCMSVFIFYHDIQNWYSVQGFLKTIIRDGGIPRSGKRDGKFCCGLFIEWWESEEEWIWQFQPFLKLKTTFYKYWTSIKIKNSMTCVYKEYQVKIKMV